MASFTCKGNGRWLKIVTNGSITTISTKSMPIPEKYNSDSILWDTGSMVTCISERLAAELHLKKTGVTTISGIENKPHIANTYMVDLIFPNNVEMSYIQVVEAPMPYTDLLVGMDVISECDFHYSIENGNSQIRIETR